MDILWRRQVNLSTILKSLPADSWTVTDGVFVRGSLLLDRVVNLTYFAVPVQEPFAGGMGAIQKIYRERNHPMDTKHK